MAGTVGSGGMVTDGDRGEGAWMLGVLALRRYREDADEGGLDSSFATLLAHSFHSATLCFSCSAVLAFPTPTAELISYIPSCSTDAFPPLPRPFFHVP
jgi:hypothetical protein